MLEVDRPPVLLEYQETFLGKEDVYIAPAMGWDHPVV
jgi:hypothetical protein